MTDRNDSQFWDRVADRYAARPIKDVAAYDAMLADAASRLTASDRVLEIGCGTGGAAIRLGPCVTHWTATDASSEMIRIARSKAAPDNVTFTVADATPTGEGAPYDAVCAFLILHLVPDMRATLAAIHRQLKPGGLLISKTYCVRDMNILMRRGVIPALQAFGVVPRFAVLSAADLRRAITEAGFVIETARTFGANRHAHYIVARKSAQ
ncbi:class I SAM-dependent methyltransferase [Rhodopseudomonas pseudopalustris]|uniref:Methyltransferase type 11 n=2 Tax=Rhodopseudomonas TaxID=1073 RepID=Q131X2_RHOPS|nr:class I SAM-dependent methyltransferase [Rhodopseudomonas pseudopalustris]ABE41117.1 Methyltransferase type 11 [Rhodopseudomonas palustris BisB5]SEP30129.1 Ubiquinone/menaquinone biosynthesis C-methylase UbiE [Rhodopseudomonas pseudopalustris]